MIKFLTLKQAAEYLNTSTDTVKREAKAGRLKFALVGKQMRFTVSALDEYAFRHERQQEAEPIKKRGRPPNARPPVDRLSAITVKLGRG